MTESTTRRAPAAERRQMPPVPGNIEATGLTEEFVTDLLLKTLYVQGARTGAELSDFLKLPFPLLDDLLIDLQQRRYCEVRGTRGVSRSSYVFDLTGEAGRGRAREAMDTSQYVGPAPVPLAQYRHWSHVQSIRHARVTRREVEDGFSWLVLPQETLDEVGPALNSGKSLFLYGDAGNGKTAIAETLARLIPGTLFVPHAIEVDGHVIVTYDPLYHRRVDGVDALHGETAALEELFQTGAPFDARFVEVHRPVVLTGGELTMDQLDLQYDEYAKMYQAPFQVKANGGVLIIDDFGRQRMPARDLLNRWIVPLEKRVDFLTLHTGGKFPVPFDCLVIFATNINPSDLVEEAFLRRIHYKIRVESPTRPMFESIFRRICEDRGVTYEERAVEQLYREFYGHYRIAPRGCHPRDVMDHLFDIAAYLEEAPELTEDLVRRAGKSYFLDFPTAA
jgi:predicted ATPase with chaperone activity